MSLMPKLSTTLLLCVSLFGASDADVVSFLKKGIGSNPNISNLDVDIIGKKGLNDAKGWQAYFIKIEGDIKQGNEKRHIIQNGTYFVNGNVMAPELINLTTGDRFNDTISPDFDKSYYSSANLISGSSSSPYKIAIFSDPLCPFCRRYVPEAVSYMEKYPKTFAVYYYHLPLSALHPAALTLTKAAIAAEQKGTKDVLSKLYSVDINPNEKNETVILKTFNEVFGTKINADDIRRPSVVKQFEFDQKAAQAMLVNGTPSVFFNGQKDPSKNKYKNVKVK